MREGLALYGVLLVVQGEDDLGDMLKPLDRGVRGEEGVSDKEDEFLEWTELDCPEMAGAIGVITRSEAEVESQDDQVGGVSSLLVRGCVDGRHDGVENAKGGGFFSSD